MGLIHKEKNLCSFLGCTTAREVQDAADDKELAAGSPGVPWEPGKHLGDFGSLYQLAWTSPKKQCFSLSYVENQDGS